MRPAWPASMVRAASSTVHQPGRRQELTHTAHEHGSEGGYFSVRLFLRLVVMLDHYCARWSQIRVPNCTEFGEKCRESAADYCGASVNSVGSGAGRSVVR